MNARLICGAWAVVTITAMVTSDAIGQHATRASARSGASVQSVLIKHAAPGGASVGGDGPPAWGMTLLPEGLEPVAASSNGIVLAYRDGNLYRWRASNNEVLLLATGVYEGFSVHQADINAHGDIAVQHYDWSGDPGWDVDWERSWVEVWPNDSDQARKYVPPTFNYTYLWDCSIEMSASLQKAFLYRLDDSANLWVRSIRSLEPFECGTYHTEGLFRVPPDGGRFTFGPDAPVHVTVSRMGLEGLNYYPPGLGDDIFVLGGRQVEYCPIYISRSGYWIGTADPGSNAPLAEPAVVGHPDGSVHELPADVARSVWLAEQNANDWTYRVWVDDRGAIHGRIAISSDQAGPWAVWVPLRTGDGASIPGAYRRTEYGELALPDGWSPTAISPLATYGTSFDWYFYRNPPVIPSAHTGPVVGLAERAGQTRGFLYIPPPVSIAVDADRDGEIEFGASDATSEKIPYRFWINDDVDRLHTFHDSAADSMDDINETEEDDIGPAEAQQKLWNADCWTNNKADSKRDLEDFSCLEVHTAGLIDSFRNGQFSLGLKWSEVTGDPAIRVYRHLDPAGGLGYLTDDLTATAQAAEYAIRDARYQNESPSSSLHAMVHGTETFILPSPLFENVSEASPRTHLLFEGVRNGKGRLKLVVLKRENGTYTEIGGGPGVWMELKGIGDMYEHWSVGNASGGAPAFIAARIPSLTGSGTAFRYDNPTPSPEERRYILYVHGWNMEQWEKERFAETAFKRLWWQGYKGRFGLFTWPCTNRFDETEHPWKLFELVGDGTHFDRGEWSAWRSGAPLRQLLQALNGGYSGQLYVFSHSMGGIAMSEALRLQSDAGGGQIVNVYVASQAALSAHLYDGTLSTAAGSTSTVQWSYDHPRFAAGGINPGPQNFGPRTTNVYRNWLAFLLNGSASSSKAVGTLVNFYNENDWALSAPVWQFNQITKPDWPDLFHSQPWTYGYMGDPAYFADAFTKSFGEITYPMALGGRADPQDRYEIMAFAAESYVKAFGATPNVSQGVSLSFDIRSIWPADNGDHKAHIWHSGQFRSNMPKQKDYWGALLSQPGFQLLRPLLP